MNIKQFEYGMIGVLLQNAPAVYEVAGTLTSQLDVGAATEVTLTLATAPTSIKGGMWLTGNAGNFQRFDYNGFADNTDGTYTFTIKDEVHTTIAAGTDAFVELKELRIYEHGDVVESQDFDFIQVMAEKPQQEFPGITGDARFYWNITTSAAFVNRIKQDEKRRELYEIYSAVEKALIIDITTTDLSTYSGIQILGFQQQEGDSGKWDNERQGVICENEVKFYYT